ncbi:CCR4-NOT transcription complex subunit 9-like isoform X2 [Halichondria panicea]|uniref:CCR4-NOT transcription complex subunit 9-like isoform X2 n=1 Tax=Halichondria panicea TaxID=6063 RepID=UPI00312BAFBF
MSMNQFNNTHVRYPPMRSISSPTGSSMHSAMSGYSGDQVGGAMTHDSSPPVTAAMLPGTMAQTPPPPGHSMIKSASGGMLFSMASSLPSSVSGGAMVMGALGVTGKSPATTSTSNNNGNSGGDNREQVYTWILELSNPDTREHALIELSKKREVLPDLAPMLWYSFGTLSALLQEIVMIYPVINPPSLTAQQSNRVCNALALLQCVASHPETRSAFLNAHIPLFLYPFLHTVSKSRPFEYLRLTSLGVVGALVKTDEQDVINFLLTTEIIPLCLRIMESGSELSKTVATFILQKILLDETGLSYICQTFERFSHVATVLGKMVQQLAKEPSARLLKHVVRCYLRLSDNLSPCRSVGKSIWLWVGGLLGHESNLSYAQISHFFG